MKSKIIWCLAGINVAMALSLVLPYIRENTLMAQQRVDRPADYMLIPGDISGSDAGVVYILDESNSVLSAMAFQDSSNRIEVLPPIDLIRVFEENAVDTNRRRGR